MTASPTSDAFAVHSMCSDAGTTAGFRYHLNAALLAVEELNGVGGILGRAVEIIDHSGEDVTSVGLADALHSQGSDYLIGPNGSSLVLRNLGVTTPRRMIQAGYNNAGILGDARRYPYYFQPHFTGEQQAVIFLAYAAECLGVRKVGVLYERSVFGESALAAHRRIAALAGVEITAETVSSTAPNLLRPITSLRRSDAELLIMLVTPSPTVRMALAALAHVGWAPVVLGQSALLNPEIYRDLPSALARSCFSTAFVKLCHAPDREVGERQRTYAKRLDDTLLGGGHMGVMAHISSPYYDWLHLLKYAIEEAGGFSTSEVRRVLESTSGYDGMISQFAFSPRCHTGVRLEDLTLASAGSLVEGGAHDGFPMEEPEIRTAVDVLQSRSTEPLGSTR